MITIDSGRFAKPHLHHENWFRVFRFHTCVEIWFGKRWIQVSRGN